MKKKNLLGITTDDQLKFEEHIADRKPKGFKSIKGTHVLIKIIRIHHECEGGIEKSVPRITDWHHESCKVMITRDKFFYPILTRTMNSFSCSPLNTSFYIGKTWKRLPENPKYAEMGHGAVILTLQ